MSDDIILGICPTCYLVVKKSEPYALEIGLNGQIAYHRECEPGRMKYMRKNEKRWAEEGEYCKNLRESWAFTIKELSEFLQVSESKLRKFESGKPVTHAKLLGMAYIMHFKLMEHIMGEVRK